MRDSLSTLALFRKLPKLPVLPRLKTKLRQHPTHDFRTIMMLAPLKRHGCHYQAICEFQDTGEVEVTIKKRLSRHVPKQVI